MADNLFRPEPFFIEFEQSYLHGDILLAQGVVYGAPDLLFLHRADHSEDRTVFNLLRQLLLSQHNLSSCAFDFYGHGSTGGNWGCSSLQERTRQALEVVDACFDCQPFSTVAVGMSAYTALKMVPECPISNMVLLTPALFASDIYTTAFYEVFNQQLPDISLGWNRTDVWEIVQDFQGGLRTVITSQDEVVSSEMVTQLDDRSVASREHGIIEITNSPHILMTFANQQPAVLSHLAQVIADTCSPQ